MVVPLLPAFNTSFGSFKPFNPFPSIIIASLVSVMFAPNPYKQFNIADLSSPTQKLVIF